VENANKIADEAKKVEDARKQKDVDLAKLTPE
jgi:hypothetical protein